MTREQMEFSISQYADGTLADEERAAVEAFVASDPETQSMLSSDRALTDLLRADPLPDIRWDRLTAAIASAIDRQTEERVERASGRMRIGFPMILATAASVLLVVGISIHLIAHRSGPSNDVAKNIEPTRTLLVLGPIPDEPEGRVVTEISISAGGTYAKDESLAPYADDIDSRPARVIIASGMMPEQSPPGFPY
jgi:anti-sigma factor RsiW